MISTKKNRLKAAVIGAGFGGIAAAIRLQARQIETTLYDKRDKPGGRAYVFDDQGFTFDAGPTVITAPECIDELFELGRKKTKDYIQMTSIDPFYRLCWEDGSQFNYTNDDEKLFAQIRERNPKDVEGYQKFLEYSDKVFQAGYTELVHVPFLSFWDMVRVSPQLIRLQAFRSVYSMVSKFIKDEKLREAFSFHSLLIGGNPFTASSIYTLIHKLERKWGVYFPKGGTHALVRALIRLFEDMGGTVKMSREVESVEVREDQVMGVCVNGKLEPCDLVVSNADVTHTYRDLLAEHSHGKRRGKQLEKSRYSNSLFVVYFGTNRKYPETAHHNILFGPRYRELLDDIFHKGKLADDFSLYLHKPTLTDPSLAPEGCEAFYALAPVPHLGKYSGNWANEGPKFAQKILSYLEKHYLPDLRKHIVTQRIFSPLDFHKELNAHVGSAFSLEPTLLQSAYFRVHNRDPQVSGLYFVGAGTHPGAGVPGVINSAKATAGVIFQDLLKNPAFHLEPQHA